ncbi:MAG: carboxypeptidase-like regulatory domain-containing protein [Polyangiaceae bacterium]
MATLLAVACAGSEDAGPDRVDAGADGAAGSAGSGSDATVSLDASSCVPATCADLGVDCGQQADGCGNLIDCGGCVAPEYCGGGGPSKCGSDPCTKKTCAEINASCGMQGDGCGGLMDCGSCTAPQTCGGGGTPNQCGGVACTPKTCTQMGFDCGPVADGCGGLVNCGSCTKAGDICGGSGKPNVCGAATVPCAKKTCADWGANCGPVSDGCGGLTASCGTCGGGECCGCGGNPSECGGAPPPCVPKTCAQLGANCGVASDGCGGLTVNCGSCGSGNCCGCGGTPNVCGGAPNCTKKTCADFPAGTCGQQSDGCGGLTTNCGTCSPPAFCGGGGPNQCGTGSTCINLQCKQVTCPTGTTSISGTVYDPAGLRPLPNVFVYVPNGTPTAFGNGATCDKCGSALSGLPLVTTLTDAAGKFTLGNMPVGVDIPVVIQIGRWRRQIKVTTTQCTNLAISASLTRLPRNKSEGDIPRIALTTGGYDSLECLLRKIGIDDSEFTNPAGSGRVNLFKGQPGTGPNQAVGKYDPAVGGASFPASTTLWQSLSSLQQYDVVLLACEGDTFSSTKPASALKAMFDYTNVGGRVFASHYHHYWVSANTNGTGSGAWGTLASWIYPSPGMLSSTYSPTVPEKVVTTFPKGSLLANWLVTVGASTSVGNLSVYDTKNSVKSYDQSRALEWIYAENTLDPALKPIARATQYLTFNTPVGVAPANQCGRFIFSDIHVSSGDKGNAFPSECKSTSMSPQEKALEFMFFDLSSSVCDESQPPPTCTKLTCADQGIQCGPAPDGCGGIIANCGICTSPQVCSTGGKCGGSICTPTTCAVLGYDCGQWSDGCGASLNCGNCAGSNTCGGGGVLGKCGTGSCTKQTCASLGYSCGLWADGCGGTLNCGSCVAPATCGGGGAPGQCGGSGCVKKSCAELGVSCGLSGDGCGGTIDCGPCGGPSCTPLDCGGRCGPQGDGCGGVLSCEACPPGTCVPTSCIKASAQCGFYPDGCGGGLDCGTCSVGTCINNKCVTVN